MFLVSWPNLSIFAAAIKMKIVTRERNGVKRDKNAIRVNGNGLLLRQKMLIAKFQTFFMS